MYLIGIDIGGTKCAACLGKSEGSDLSLISKVRIPTIGAPNTILDTLISEIEWELSKDSIKFSDIAAIGVSCGGPLDSRNGVIMSPPNLPGWDNVRVCEYIEKKTGCRAALQNDANACALAEWKFGAGRGYDSMVFLTFGTGFGAGLILDGKLYSGATDNAGEIGHVRLENDGPVGYRKAGSVEGFCSGGGIAQLGKTAVSKALDRGERPKLLDYIAQSGGKGEVNEITAQNIAELAALGDTLCTEVYNVCADKLGFTLAMLMDILDVQLVVIGSIFMRAEALLRERMEKVINREALCPCPVVAAGLGEKIGDYAALSIAYTLAAEEEKNEQYY